MQIAVRTITTLTQKAPTRPKHAMAAMRHASTARPTTLIAVWSKNNSNVRATISFKTRSSTTVSP